MKRRRAAEQYFHGLTPAEFSALARYNGERYRGVLHTPEYAGRMAELQARFDQHEEDASGRV